MFRNDIAVIRAVQSDRIQRDIFASRARNLAPRESLVLAVRRAIGRSIVRLGARIAAEPASGRPFDLAGSR